MLRTTAKLPSNALGWCKAFFSLTNHSGLTQRFFSYGAVLYDVIRFASQQACHCKEVAVPSWLALCCNSLHRIGKAAHSDIKQALAGL
jgi:hypothetical protein